MLDLLTALLDLVWPPVCIACGCAAPESLCAGCRRNMPWIGAEQCTLCQERARVPDHPRCLPCTARRRPMQACVAGVRFEDEAAIWIKRFKYASPWQASLGASERARIRTLAHATLGHAPVRPPHALVPIPLHRRRLRTRGFNPSLVIARELARETGASVKHALVRTRDTPSQTGLSRSARRRNVADAFAVRGAVPERVWLVDDVVTTGATLEAAARTLRRAGAKDVVGICLARTPPRTDASR